MTVCHTGETFKGDRTDKHWQSLTKNRTIWTHVVAKDPGYEVDAGYYYRSAGALAKWQVNVSSTCVLFGHPLTLTYVDFVELTVALKSTHVFHRLAAQRKPTQADRKSVYTREIYYFLQLASRLANSFGRPSEVRTQVLVLQTCVDLRRLASPFAQGLTEELII